MSILVAPTVIVPRQLFDQNANPLAGGQIFTWQAGGGNTQPTYSDSQGLNENTNPVICDGSGRNSVYLDQSLVYHIQIQDANGNIFDDQDGISGDPFSNAITGVVLTTTNQVVGGVKAFSSTTGFGTDTPANYSANSLQVTVGSTSTANSGIRIVATTTGGITFGTTYTGGPASKGALTYNLTSDTMNFTVASAAALTITSAAVAFALPASAITANGHHLLDSSSVIPIAQGGSGQVTANASLNAFLPSQTSNAGKILSTDGTNSLWATNGSTGSGSITPNGYWTFPGGLIAQWGKVGPSPGGGGGVTPTSYTFPIAFPNACFSVVASSTPTNATCYVGTVTRTNFGIANGAGGNFTYWVAWGF